MSPEEQTDPELQPWQRRLSDRMTKPPASVKKGLLISAFLPGMGEIYQGDRARGIRVFIYAVTLGIMCVFTSHIFFPLGPMAVRILHSILLIGVLAVWLYSIIRTVQFYEAEIRLWRAKKGIPSFKERFDVKAYLRNIREKGGRHNVEENLDEMLGNPKRSIVRMSLVVSLTYLVTKLNVFMDKVWIANISEAAVAAIGTVSPIYSVVSAAGVGIGTGACVCISYVLGRREYEKTQDLATASVFLSLAVSVPLGIFMVLSIHPIVGVEGAEITELASEYVIPLAIGCPVVILSGVLGGLFKAEGAMRKMTFCALVSIPVNMVLTPVLIYGAGWGIMGASIANVIGSAVSVAVALYLFRKGGYHFRIRFGIPTSTSMKEISSVGGPKAVEEMIGGLIILAQSMIIVTKTGSDTLALVELAFAFPYFMTLVPDSITAGAQPVCSAHAGERDISGMRRSIMYAMKINMVISLAAMVFMLVFASPLCSLFSGGDQSRVTDELLTVTRLFAFMIPMYLLGRMSGDMLQVVRKSDMSAIVFSAMGIMRLAMYLIWGNDTMEVAWMDLIGTSLAGLVMFILLMYYVRRFDPDEVDRKSESRSNIFSVLRDRRAAAE